MDAKSGQRPAYSAAMLAVRRAVGARPGDTLPAYAWPGGYPLYYLTARNACLCATCATAGRDADIGDGVVAYAVHYEGGPVACDDCGLDIDSAYGDPDGGDDE